MNRFVKFFLTVWFFFIIVSYPFALYLPPDPYAQLPFMPIIFGIPLVAAYWLVYRDGFATIRAKVA